MQTKRSKRSRIRAAKVTAGHGHKKKNRGAGHRGGRGKSGTGKRGDFKLMKLKPGGKNLGKHGFVSLKEQKKAINLGQLQLNLNTLYEEEKIKKSKDAYEIDLKKLGYDKLLSKGDVYTKMNISVDSATKRAIKKVEEKQGKVILPNENA